MSEMEQNVTRFSSALPIIVLTRPGGEPDADWQELDRGPGFFSVPDDQEIRVRLKGIGDAELMQLARELAGVKTLRFLDLSENRNVSNAGLKHLRVLTQLTGMNLSACGLTDTGLAHLSAFTHLSHLNLSYCNKLSDPALKTLEAMKNLLFVDLHGCVGLTNGGLARVRRKNLTIKT